VLPSGAYEIVIVLFLDLVPLLALIGLLHSFDQAVHCHAFKKLLAIQKIAHMNITIFIYRKIQLLRSVAKNKGHLLAQHSSVVIISLDAHLLAKLGKNTSSSIVIIVIII
jgi:hypothetical protein